MENDNRVENKENNEIRARWRSFFTQAKLDQFPEELRNRMIDDLLKDWVVPEPDALQACVVDEYKWPAWPCNLFKRAAQELVDKNSLPTTKPRNQPVSLHLHSTDTASVLPVALDEKLSADPALYRKGKRERQDKGRGGKTVYSKERRAVLRLLRTLIAVFLA
jgi:hypothetical protein